MTAGHLLPGERLTAEQTHGVRAQISNLGSNSFGRHLAIKVTLPVHMEVTSLYIDFRNKLPAADATVGDSSSGPEGLQAAVQPLADESSASAEQLDTLPWFDDAMQSMAEPRDSGVPRSAPERDPPTLAEPAN